MPEPSDVRTLLRHQLPSSLRPQRQVFSVFLLKRKSQSLSSVECKKTERHLGPAGSRIPFRASGKAAFRCTAITRGVFSGSNCICVYVPKNFGDTTSGKAVFHSSQGPVGVPTDAESGTYVPCTRNVSSLTGRCWLRPKALLWP